MALSALVGPFLVAPPRLRNDHSSRMCRPSPARENLSRYKNSLVRTRTWIAQRARQVFLVVPLSVAAAANLEPLRHTVTLREEKEVCFRYSTGPPAVRNTSRFCDCTRLLAAGQAMSAAIIARDAYPTRICCWQSSTKGLILLAILAGLEAAAPVLSIHCAMA